MVDRDELNDMIAEQVGDTLEEGFIDKFTRMDNIMLRMMLAVEKLQVEGITVQMPAPDEKEKPSITLIRTIPDDGEQYFTFGEDNNFIDFEKGYIKEGDGTVTKMKDILPLNETIKSLMIYATRDSTIDFGEGSGLIPIIANTWMSFDGINIKSLYYRHTTSAIIESYVTIIAATTPGGISAAIDPKYDGIHWCAIGTSGIYAAEIAQNAISYEDISVDGNAYEISHIIISSEANLSFRLWFFDKDDHPGTFAGFVDFDIPTYGDRIAGAGLYYLDVSGLSMKGIDGDYSSEMHIGLQNLSATQKETTDSVTIDIYYKLLNDAAVI